MQVNVVSKSAERAAQRWGKSLCSANRGMMGRGSSWRIGVGRAGDTTVAMGASTTGGGRFSMGMSASGMQSMTFSN